jgi:hypothetical protein
MIKMKKICLGWSVYAFDPLSPTAHSDSCYFGQSSLSAIKIFLFAQQFLPAEPDAARQSEDWHPLRDSLVNQIAPPLKHSLRLLQTLFAEFDN